MYLRTVTLGQFRRFTYEEFTFEPGLNVIKGPNGSGKTSLLEAIYYLSRGQSFRTHRDQACVQHEATSFSLNGTIANDESVELGLALETEGNSTQKVAQRNGELLDRLSDLQGTLPTVLFTPRHTRLLTDSPANRRQFVNRFIGPIDSTYVDHLRQYERIREQRNELLKQDQPDRTLLNEYEDHLVENGLPVIQTRQTMVEALEQQLQDILKELENPWNEVTLRYRPDTPGEELERELVAARDRDRSRGFTTVGPHRDDWMVYCDDQPAGEFVSRGERRLLVISLKFAEANVIVNRNEKQPLLLLDDLESELDDATMRSCLAWCEDHTYQVLLTGTSHPSEGFADRILSLDQPSEPPTGP